MSSATVYSLEGKNLKLTSREDIEPYITELNAIEDLQEIHLGGNTLGVGACQALGEALQNKKNLRVAKFADIFTGRLISEIPDALRALCDSLIEHTSLVEINLSDNAFGGRSAEPMVNFLTRNHHFEILKLNNNGLGIQGGKIVATALIEAAAELKKLDMPSKLKTVICGRNRLEDGSAPIWAKAYAAHGNLEEVRMFQNGIRMDGIIAITQGLASCPNLKVLDLQDNTATIRGSRGIASCLPKWTYLEVLNLSDCLLKPKGGYLVIDALGKGTNSNLKTLQLQYCDLDRKALEHLALVIGGEAIKGLEKLDINGNWADEEDECIEKIKKGLEKHGHEDALDELDEMDPDGEEDEEEEEEEEENGNKDKEAASDDEKEEDIVLTNGDKHEPQNAEADNTEEQSKEATSDQEKSTETPDVAETSAAAVAVPAAAAAVAGAGLIGAASLLKESAGDKAEELDLLPAKPKEEDKQDFAETKNVEEVFDDKAAPLATTTNAEEDQNMADTAAETAEKVEEAPEEAVAAGVAAETAEKAEEVPEEIVASNVAAEVSQSAEMVQAGDAKELTNQTSSALVADEVSQEAEKAGVSNNEEAQEAMKTDEADRKDAAGTADEVAESAQPLHASDEKAKETSEEDAGAIKNPVEEVKSVEAEKERNEEGASTKAVPETSEEDNLAGAMAKTTITDPSPSTAVKSKHGKIDSVDLSGELYAGQAGQSTSEVPEEPTAEPPKKRFGFRAAMGAVRELLKY